MVSDDLREAIHDLAQLLYAASQVLRVVVNAVSYAVSVLSLVWVRVPFQAERTPRVRRSPGAEIVEGWRWPLGHPLLAVTNLPAAVRGCPRHLPLSRRARPDAGARRQRLPAGDCAPRLSAVSAAND